MTELTQIDSYGALIGPDTLRIQRLLPGPIERVWAYLADSELRKLWLAAGDIELVEGAPFELVWRNDELAAVRTGDRPKDMPEEHRMQSEVIVADAPRKLVIAWNNTGNVTFELEPVWRGRVADPDACRLPDAVRPHRSFGRLACAPRRSRSAGVRAGAQALLAALAGASRRI